MYVLAVSDFLRSIFIILVATPFILLWGSALIDLVLKHQYRGWAVVGWLLLIFLVPIIGPIIYFAVRKPSAQEIDRQYLLDHERQAAGAARTVPRPGLGPY